MKGLLEKTVLTYEDIHSLPEGNYEIIDGEMVPMTPAGFRHGGVRMFTLRNTEKASWFEGLCRRGRNWYSNNKEAIQAQGGGCGLYK